MFIPPLDKYYVNRGTFGTFSPDNKTKKSRHNLYQLSCNLFMISPFRWEILHPCRLRDYQSAKCQNYKILEILKDAWANRDLLKVNRDLWVHHFRIFFTSNLASADWQTLELQRCKAFDLKAHDQGPIAACLIKSLAGLLSYVILAQNTHIYLVPTYLVGVRTFFCH